MLEMEDRRISDELTSRVLISFTASLKTSSFCTVIAYMPGSSSAVFVRYLGRRFSRK